MWLSGCHEYSPLCLLLPKMGLNKLTSAIMWYDRHVFPAVASGPSDALEPSGLMSPCSTVRSLTKELQHSLDLASATSGDKVVTAQVSEAPA